MDSFQLLAGTIGVVIGIILTKVFDIIQIQWQTQRIRRSIRQMIELEIDQNLDQCHELKERVATSLSDDMTLAAKNLAAVPIPGLSRAVLNSQLTALAQALTKEEIQHVLQIYNSFDRIEIIRTMISSAWSSQQSAKREGMLSPIAAMLPTSFERHASRLWLECEAIIAKALDDGNPLKRNKKP